MNLARFSVARPVTAGIISVALFVVGFFYMSKLPVSLWPNVTFPFVSVMVPYPGATPEQVEARIVKPLESSFAGLKGLKRVTANARTDYAFVILEFRLSADEREAAEGVRERVAAVRGAFPKEAKEPIVRRIDVGAAPVLTYGIETSLPPAATRKLLDDGLVQILQRVDGVNEAKVVGVGEERLELSLDADAMSALKVPALDVFDAVRARLATLPWGTVENGGVAANVGATVASDKPEDWAEESLALRDGRNVRLSDVGKLHRTTDPNAETVRINGNQGLGLVVTKRAEANTVSTVAAVKAVLEKAQLPAGVRLFPIVDQSHMIKENEHEVWIALFAGGIFAVVIIFLFLTDVKSAIISATALPVAVVGSFIFLSLLGFSINMLTLLALALAIGLLIDDAVVVRESIYAEMEQGYRGAEAAIRGTDKVASAVLATTLAVVAVFVPVAMMDGLVGQFFREFGLTIVIATLLSMWVAFTLDPMLSSRFAGEPSMLKGKLWDRWRATMHRSDAFFGRLAGVAYARPFVIALLTIGVLISGLALTAARGTDFLAFEDRGQFVLSLKSRPGMTRATFQAVVKGAADRLADLPGLTDVFVSEGGATAAGTAEFRVLFISKTERKEGLLSLINSARKKLEGIDADWLILDPPPFEGVGMQAPVMLTIFGTDLGTLDQAASAAHASLKKIKGIADARIDTTTAGPAFDVLLNRNEIAYAGAGADAVELTGRLAITGLEAGTVGADNLPFYVRVQESDREFGRLASTLLVPGMRGATPLYRFADAQASTRSTAIDRQQRSRAVILWATLDRTAPLDQVLNDVKKDVVAKIPAPMTAEIAGDAENFEEMIVNFTIAIAAAVFFIFVILAAQFENLLRPFVIILSLPLASVGAFFALAMAGHQLALGSIIGILFLMGLAAKNGILLVDAIGKKEKDQPLAQAVMDSVKERSRPILMTSAAMVAGMVPTAVMQGSGSEFRSPMAIAIIGGVVSSTLLSLIVVPAIFGLIGKWRGRTRKPARLATAARAASLLLPLALVATLEAPRARAEAPAAGSPIDRAYALFGTLPPPAQAQIVAATPEGSAESLRSRAVDVATETARDASRLAFLGGLNVSASRQWARPGFEQEMTIPLPPQLGGPVTTAIPVLPRQQDQFSVGMKVPLFNAQALYGLSLANALDAQQEPQIESLRDGRRVGNAQTLLQFAIAREMNAIIKNALSIAERRAKSVEDRVSVGNSSRLDLVQAEAAREQARLDAARAAAEEERLAILLQIRTGRPPQLPPGLPRFAFADAKTEAKVAAITALTAAEESQRAARDAQDAAFYPTLGLGLARQQTWFEGNLNTKPQHVVAVELNWNLLDGGTRRRAVGDVERGRLELAAQRRELEDRFAETRQGLIPRLARMTEELGAALSLREAALASQTALQAAWGAGTIAMDKVRTADEQLLRANLGVLQAIGSIQGLALESLVAYGKLKSLE